MSYSDLVTVKSKSLKEKSYVEFYFKGERIREYSGESLDLLIEPNSTTTIKERDRLLIKLEYEIHRALDGNCYPATPINRLRQLPAADLLDYAIKVKTDSLLSQAHIKHMMHTYRLFKAFLTVQELSQPITFLTTYRIQQFLNPFSTSELYYMGRRGELNIMFNDISKYIDFELDAVRKTDRLKIKKKIHKVFDPHKLVKILAYLKVFHPDMHLCALFVYGCFLRPHQEVKNLRGRHFKNDFTEIHLAGNENKSKAVRVVNIPDYVRNEILERVSKLKSNDYLLVNKDGKRYSDHYFVGRWRDHRGAMLSLGLIEEGHSIYTFRRSAAINVYKRTKDIFLIQRLLGHSELETTIKYLTGLGIAYGNEDLKANMPTLD